MDKTKDLVLNALKYYDTNSEKYSKIFTKTKYYSLEMTQSDIEHNIIILFDKDKNEIFRSRYEYLGLYYSHLKLWVWGWSIASLQKNEILLSKKILNYGIDLGKDFAFLKSELITSRFRISDEIQLDIHISIASYIAKNPIICRIIHPPIYSGKLSEDSQVELYEFQDKLTDDSIVNFIYLLDDK